MSRSDRSHLRSLVPPLLAALLCLVRWWIQGASGVWTKLALRPYRPDPDLGWRRQEEELVWLGLDAVLICVLVALGVWLGYWLLRKRSGKGGILRLFLGAVSVAPLALPAAAFLSGSVPEGARATLPHRERSATTTVEAGLTSVPSGNYQLLEHRDAAVVVSVEAGGERFDARFAGGLEGSWSGNPATLGEAMTGWVSVDAGSLDSDLGERDDHAKGYLKVDSHPRIRFELESIQGSRAAEGNAVELSLGGHLQLMGRRHSIVAQGRLSVPDTNARKRLQLPDGPLMLLDADFPLDLGTTAIEEPTELFDSLDARVHLTLFWIPTSP